MALPITFANLSGQIPLADLDQNFNYIASGNGSAVVGYNQGGSGAVTQTLQSKLQQIVSVSDFGTTGNGSTDDSSAIQLALYSGAKIVFLPTPSSYYYCASGLIVPEGVTLYSQGCTMDATIATPTGTSLVFALSVQNCVQMGTGSGNKSCKIAGFNIIRKAGTPPALSNGVLVTGTYGALISEIYCLSHAIGATFKSDGIVSGIATFSDRFFTGAIYDSHIVQDTMPEVRFTNCRFGSNGNQDQNCNSFIRVQGGSTTNATGPNTLVFTGCQFNEGGATPNVNYLIYFANKTVGSIADNSMWQFDNCYIESCLSGVGCDSTWASIGRFMMSNSNFNVTTSTYNFLNFAQAVDLNDWTITNCKISCQVAYTFSTNHLNNFIMTGCDIGGIVNLNGAGASISNISLDNNIYGGGLSLTGAFTASSYVGGNMNGGSLTFTANGVGLYVAPYTNGAIPWFPVFNINGSSTGITGSLSGEYQVIGRMLYGNYRIILTSKGANSGSVTITGMPYNSTVAPYDAFGGAVTYVQSMTGLTGALVVRIQTTTQLLVEQFGTTGTSAIADTNLTNTSAIYGTFAYPI